MTGLESERGGKAYQSVQSCVVCASLVDSNSGLFSLSSSAARESRGKRKSQLERRTNFEETKKVLPLYRDWQKPLEVGSLYSLDYS
jgi:hypothetical protein